MMSSTTEKMLGFQNDHKLDPVDSSSISAPAPSITSYSADTESKNDEDQSDLKKEFLVSSMVQDADNSLV